MFILTVDSNDQKKIAEVLAELSKNYLDSNAVGMTANVDYEYDIFPEQEWIMMGEFLVFNEDGNTLKKAT